MYIYQRHNDDCMQATLANLLCMPYESIPEFYKTFNNDGNRFVEALDKFLIGAGYFRITVDVKVRDDKTIAIPFSCSPEKLYCIGILEKQGREYSHAVLLEVIPKEKTPGFRIAHDPSPNSEYDIYDLIQVEFIMKK